jgi:hypothetical protein
LSISLPLKHDLHFSGAGVSNYFYSGDGYGPFEMTAGQRVSQKNLLQTFLNIS